MIVLDTHAWIWWVDGDSRLSAAAAREIHAAESIGVSVMSVFEVATAVRRGRLKLDRDLWAWVGQALDRPRVAELSVDAELAAAAGRLAGMHGDPIDRLIVATAIARRATLVTRDRKLREFPAVRCVW